MSASGRWDRAALGTLAALVAVRMVAGFQFHSVAVVAPLLVAELGLSYTEVGSLIGAYVLPAVLLSIPGGLVIQRFGERRVLLASLGLTVIGGVLTAIAPGFASMFAARVVAGAGAALVQIVLLKMATDRFMGGRLSTATGTVLGAWPLGIALALALLGVVAQQAGWRAALAVAAAYAVFALLAAWRLPRIFAGTEGHAPGSSAGTSASSGAAKQLVADTGKGLAGLGAAVAISVSWMVLNIGYTAFIAFAPTWLTSTGWSLEAAGFAVSLSGWALVATQPWGGWLADRLGRPSLVLAVGCLVSGAAIGLALFTGGAVPLFLLAGVAMGFTPGVMGAQLAMSAAPARRAVALGFFATGSGAGSMLGPSLAGVVVDLTGAQQAAIAMAAVLMAAALLPWWWARRLQRRQPIR